MIGANYIMLHMDQEIWGDPENFRPERFITADGKLNVALDKSLPFGAGKAHINKITLFIHILIIYKWIQSINTINRKENYD